MNKTSMRLSVEDATGGSLRYDGGEGSGEGARPKKSAGRGTSARKW